MNESKCKNCGKPLQQTPGKRTKVFCKIACRSNYWQKQQRLKGNPTKNQPASPATSNIESYALSYNDYKTLVKDAPNTDECRRIGEKVQISGLADWQKREVIRMAIEKSQQFDF